MPFRSYTLFGCKLNRADLSVEWAKPISQNRLESGRVAKSTVANFSELVKITPSVSVAFGVGFGLDFTVGYLEGKFIAHFSGQLVFGPGGAGGVAAELKVEQVVELIQFVRQALEQTDFRFLEWITETAFDMISKIMSLHVVIGESISSFVGLLDYQLDERWENLTSSQEAIKNECTRILLPQRNYRFLTPIAKAAVLDRVCKTYVFEPHSFNTDDDELQAAACMKLLESMKSEREFIEVLRLMGRKGNKGNSNTLVSNYKRIFDNLLFQSKQKTRARNWLKNRAGSSYLSLE